MLLALLAAVMDDVALEAGRRASSHELRRRLSLDAPPPETGVVVRLRMEMLRYKAEPLVALTATYLLLNQIGTTYSSSTPAELIAQGQRNGEPLVEVLPVGYDSGNLAVLLAPDEVDERAGPLIAWMFARTAAIYREDAARIRQHLEDPVFNARPSPTWTLRLKNAWRDELPNVLDWFHATHPDLTRFSIPEAIDAATTWHAALPAGSLPSGLEPGIVVARWADGATLQRLVTRRAVEDEGKAMRHCVGSHWSDVARGVAVFSYRDVEGNPQATFEVESQRLSDLEGFKNGVLTDVLVAGRVWRWLADTNVKTGTWGRKLPESVQRDQLPGVAIPLRFYQEDPKGPITYPLQDSTSRRFSPEVVAEDWARFPVETQRLWVDVVAADREIGSLRLDENAWASARGGFPAYPAFGTLTYRLYSLMKRGVWTSHRPDEGRLGSLSYRPSADTAEFWFSAPRRAPYDHFKQGWIYSSPGGYQIVVEDLIEGLVQAKLGIPGFEAAAAAKEVYAVHQARLRPVGRVEAPLNPEDLFPVATGTNLKALVQAADVAGLPVPPRARARAFR
jgi:hypothetical protein